MPSSSKPLISVQNVSKCYHVFDTPLAKLRHALMPVTFDVAPKNPLARWRKAGASAEFWALRDVTLEVFPGEAVGILGKNGSGKSTLLQMIAGTLQPTMGSVETRGRIAALLELGSGFNPEFTGRENVILNGMILGLTEQELLEKFDDIAAFADIGEFMDQPLKTYSSGMMLRLAFAVQTQIEPDVMIVDEALAVGDALFQKRCFQQLAKLRDSGCALLLVSHDQETVRTLTSRALLLSGGQIAGQGPSADVVLMYRRTMHEEENAHYLALPQRKGEVAESPKAGDMSNDEALDIDKSFGDRRAEITAVEVQDVYGQRCAYFQTGDTMRIKVRGRANAPLRNLNVNVRLRNKEGVKIYSWGTLNQDMAVWHSGVQQSTFWEKQFEPGDEFLVMFECDCPLGMNFYEVQASVSEERDRYYAEQTMLHWLDEASFFQVVVRPREHVFGGVADMRMKADWE